MFTTSYWLGHEVLHLWIVSESSRVKQPQLQTWSLPQMNSSSSSSSSELVWLQLRLWEREEPMWWWAAGGRPTWTRPWRCCRARTSKWLAPPVTSAKEKTEKNWSKRWVFLKFYPPHLWFFSQLHLHVWSTWLHTNNYEVVSDSYSSLIDSFRVWTRLWISAGA